MATAAGLYTHDKDPVTGLTARQKAVYEGLTADPPKTQLQIAEELGISRQRVRQIVEDVQRKGYSVGKVKPPPPVST